MQWPTQPECLLLEGWWELQEAQAGLLGPGAVEPLF